MYAIYADIYSLNPDVVVITETFLSSKHSDSLFHIDGFITFRKDRPKRKGGGVCVLVRECLLPTLVDEKVFLEFSEALWLRLHFNGQRFLICACYHPPRPKYPVDCFINYLDNNIDDLIDPSDAAFVLTGDLNQLPVTNLEIRHGLSQLVTSPTRSGHILDMFYTSRPDLFCFCNHLCC